LKIYCDTSFLLKLYIREPDSDKAIDAIQQTEPHYLPFNRFIELELHSAIEGKMFRKEISLIQLESALKIISDHSQTGFLRSDKFDWNSTFELAKELVHTVGTRRHGARTLDLIHIAIASKTSCERFLTFDHRQGRVAQALGMEVELL